MIDVVQWRISIGCFYASRGHHSNTICNIDAYIENTVKKLKTETSNALDRAEEILYWHNTNQQSLWQQLLLETFDKNETVSDDETRKDSLSGMSHNVHMINAQTLM